MPPLRTQAPYAAPVAVSVPGPPSSLVALPAASPDIDEIDTQHVHVRRSAGERGANGVLPSTPDASCDDHILTSEFTPARAVSPDLSKVPAGWTAADTASAVRLMVLNSPLRAKIAPSGSSDTGHTNGTAAPQPAAAAVPGRATASGVTTDSSAPVTAIAVVTPGLPTLPNHVDERDTLAVVHDIHLLTASGDETPRSGLRTVPPSPPRTGDGGAAHDASGSAVVTPDSFAAGTSSVVLSSHTQTFTPRNLLRAGFAAMKKNFVPGLVLQAIGLTIIILYFTSDAVAQGFASLAAFKTQTGFGFSFVGTAISGGVVPWVINQFKEACMLRAHVSDACVRHVSYCYATDVTCMSCMMA